MLSRKELDGYRKITGFNLGQVEKDYLQHIVLLLLSRSVGDELVFKGGTCLQKVFGLNRFSEDLDFTQCGSVNFEDLSSSIARGLRGFGYSSSLKIKKKKIAIGFNIKVQGPLYQGTERSVCSLHMEFSLREDVLFEPEFKTLHPIYEDLPAYSTLVMNPKELLAEKVRALLTRNRARDLYDIYFLLKKNTALEKDVMDKKMQYYKRTTDLNKISEAIQAREATWEREIPQLTPLIYDFRDVKKFILDEVKRSYESG
ncbi:MAG: nucleotidyl transferase AbiEii/AbiGii toxin family protein [Thermoplasmata archaeon]|nr:MAG: nucleotidyl transferase AbiEii/AbiGii toxin family protein [Thermoplasmata archaeon]